MKKRTRTRILYMIIYALCVFIVLLLYENFVAAKIGYTSHVPTTYVASPNGGYTIEEKVGDDVLTNEEALDEYVEDQIGTISIPSVDLEAPIIQGASNDDVDMQKTMNFTIGHEPGSYLPGEGREIVLTGHREEQFKGLADVKEGDLVIVQILDDQFLYEVTETKIVDPEGSEAIEYVRGETEDETLVMYTCYPFTPGTYVSNRYVVKAKRIKSKEYDKGEAEELFDADEMEEIKESQSTVDSTESE